MLFAQAFYPISFMFLTALSSRICLSPLSPPSEWAPASIAVRGLMFSWNAVQVLRQVGGKNTLTQLVRRHSAIPIRISDISDVFSAPFDYISVGT